MVITRGVFPFYFLPSESEYGIESMGAYWQSVIHPVYDFTDGL